MGLDMTINGYGSKTVCEKVGGRYTGINVIHTCYA